MLLKATGAVPHEPGVVTEMHSDYYNVIRQWIAEGGKYDEHWAYQPLGRPESPAVPDGMEALNPIDHFVTARLAENGLPQSQEADRVTLMNEVDPKVIIRVAAAINGVDDESLEEVEKN